MPAEDDGMRTAPDLRHAYIKFQTQEDSVLGFYELATHADFSRLSNDIFCVPWVSLAILDARQVEYSFATEDEMTNIHTIWKFADARTR